MEVAATNAERRLSYDRLVVAAGATPIRVASEIAALGRSRFAGQNPGQEFRCGRSSTRDDRNEPEHLVGRVVQFVYRLRARPMYDP